MLTHDVVVRLAQAYEPYLLFDPTERFFPVAAEEMLSHASPEPWNAPTTHQRGSSVLVVDKTATVFGDADVKAGSHAPAGAHLELSQLPPHGIGQNFAHDSAAQDVFLNVGGWEDAAPSEDPAAPRFSVGSLEYLNLLFRSLGNSLNPTLPPGEPSPPPKFQVPRLKNPTVYVECEWAGRFPRLDRRRVEATNGTPDFPAAIRNSSDADPTLTELDSYVALTYYLLYPAHEPAPVVRNDGVRKREGQWEAITVFLRGRTSDRRDPDGRPDFTVELGFDGVVSGLEPRFVAYSQGYDSGQDAGDPLKAEVRAVFPAGSTGQYFPFGSHPLVYVSAGTHKNLFEITAIVNKGDSEPDPALNTAGGAMMGAAGTAAGVCLGLAPPPLTPAAIVCLIVAAVIILIGLLLFLLSFLLQDDPPVSQAPNPGSTDLARGGGPATVPSGQGPVSTPGLPPSGNTVSAELRIINRFRFDPIPPVPTYPLPAPLLAELPTWWEYVGRWGVRVRSRPSSDWESGTRRTDGFGRSRGYWNTYQLVRFLNDPARDTDGITA